MIRTDLAVESGEMLREKSGIKSDVTQENGIKITVIEILTDEASQRIGKPKGKYITIETESLQDVLEDRQIAVTEILTKQLKKLIPRNKSASALVVGLGNRFITPDSVGPKTASKIVVTRHVKAVAPASPLRKARSVSAIAPGVLGITGIETSEAVDAVVQKTSPDFVVCVDALASRCLSRLGTTIQLSDSGISPGSGVGNHRNAITENTLGIPVIAMGVPMVVDIGTVAHDVMEIISESSAIDDADSYGHIIREMLCEKGKNMIVAPNDADAITDRASDIIAEALNKTFI